MNAVRQLIGRVKSSGVRRRERVSTASMGRERVFSAYDMGEDTFIFEQGVSFGASERPSVLIVEKRSLRRRAMGRVMTVSTGNHAVAAMPLLDGRFWKISGLSAARRSETMMGHVLCANVVGGVLEVSQRDVATEEMVGHDRWLQEKVGLAKGDIVMIERNVSAIEYYRRMGEEWRVKPLAWTQGEMKVALEGARKRISTKLEYFHSARGVHFLTYPEFLRFAARASEDIKEFVSELRELVSVLGGNMSSFTRMPKYRGHHEIEFFGVRRGLALERIVPELEKLMESIVLGRIGQLGVIQKIREVETLYASLLARADLAEEGAKGFVETLYMYITGEIYSVVGEGTSPAFDDRRTALPGATFEDGRPIMHTGADSRTELLLSNLRGLMSKDEIIEYANVYELRADDAEEAVGRGATREVVYKTNRRPLENAMVEKQLSHSSEGYSCYLLSRIGALRSLGVGLSEFYMLLKRRAGTGRSRCDYYIRRRCEGEPMEAIPENYFKNADDATVEEREVVLALATLIGDAAAQNMAMKKYDPKKDSSLFGVGKEIYEFEYDIARERVMPKKVSTCSVRGSFGWPSLEYTEENLAKIVEFYLTRYAEVLVEYARKHPVVAMGELAERFMGGFEYRTRAMAWQLSVMRDRFVAFRPPVKARYGFAAKWKFVMWSLERQERRLEALKREFIEKVNGMV